MGAVALSAESILHSTKRIRGAMEGSTVFTPPKVCAFGSTQDENAVPGMDFHTTIHLETQLGTIMDTQVLDYP